MILVTGSTGFIGSHLVRKIPNTIGLDKRPSQTTTIVLDLLDKEKLFWKLSDLNIETVLHNAALPSVPASYENPMQTYHNNVSASINLIDVCKKLKIQRFIFASTSSVYGPSPYGHSKKVVEDILEHSGLRYTTLRYFNVFGVGQRPNILKIMFDAISNNKELVINGDGEIKRDFTYIDNVVQANLDAIHSDFYRNIIEVGCGKPHSLNELYLLMKSILNPEYDKIKYGPRRKGDLEYSCAKVDPNKICIPFEEGVKKWILECAVSA